MFPNRLCPQPPDNGAAAGREVLLSEPLYWGMRVSVMDLDLLKVRGQWRVEASALEEFIARKYEQTREFVRTHPFGTDDDAD